MSENEKLQNAITVLLQGDRNSAARELWQLEPKIQDAKLRIQLIDALLSASNFIDGGENLLALNQEGIEIAKKYNNKQLEAHFILGQITLLEGKLIAPLYEKSNLKLARNWLEFPTESDKSRFKECEKEINETNNKIEKLFSEANIIAKDLNSKVIFAQILLTRGELIHNHLINLKSEYLRGRISTKLWLKFNFLRQPFFNFITIYGSQNRKRIKVMTKNFVSAILTAAKIFEELNDLNAGYAYFKLANALSGSYKFKTAQNYLNKARIIANNHLDKLLLKQISIVQSKIKEKTVISQIIY